MGYPQPWPRYQHNLEGAWHAIDDLRQRYDEMQIADEVAAKVRQEIRDNRLLHLTFLQKLGGALVGGVAFADLLRNLLGS